MDISNEKEILKKVIEVAKYIPSFIDEPVSVAVTNTESFIYNQPCKEIPVVCNLGEPFAEGSTPLIVMANGKKTIREVPDKVYGIPFKSYAIPLYENGKIVGCLMIAKSIENINNVKNAIFGLVEETERVVNVVNEISSEIQTVSINNQEINLLMNDLLNETEKMNKIISVINKISNSSKMLGLNASIEAARVGAAGRGFSVVAKEIEKMGNETTQSAKDISNMLNGVEEQVNVVNKKSKGTTEAINLQANALEEISKAMSSLNENIKIIASYAEKL